MGLKVLDTCAKSLISLKDHVSRLQEPGLAEVRILLTCTVYFQLSEGNCCALQCDNCNETLDWYCSSTLDVWGLVLWSVNMHSSTTA